MKFSSIEFPLQEISNYLFPVVILAFQEPQRAWIHKTQQKFEGKWMLLPNVAIIKRLDI